MMTNQQIRITHDQAKRLAELIHSLRGDWDVKGILAALYEAGGKGGNFDVAQAAIRAAASPANRTPAIIALEGPHWRFDEAIQIDRGRRGTTHPQVCTKCRHPHEFGAPCDVNPHAINRSSAARAAAIEAARAVARGEG